MTFLESSKKNEERRKKSSRASRYPVSKMATVVLEDVVQEHCTALRVGGVGQQVGLLIEQVRRA